MEPVDTKRAPEGTPTVAISVLQLEGKRDLRIVTLEKLRSKLSLQFSELPRISQGLKSATFFSESLQSSF